MYDSGNSDRVYATGMMEMCNMTIDYARYPLSLEINGYGTVTSRRRYSRAEVEDIIQLVVDVVDTVAISPNDVRLIPRGVKVTEI